MKMKTTRAARGRPRLFDRDAMLQKALMLFWERGYEGTSVAQLVQAMGITPPSLYAAFGSKEGLYRAAVELYLLGPGQFVALALAEEPTARDAVERILRQAVHIFTAKTHPRGCVIATSELVCAPENRELARTIAGLRAMSIDATAQRLARAKKEGELPASVNVKALARFYGAIIQGMSVQAKDGATTAELSSIADLAILAWPRK